MFYFISHYRSSKIIQTGPLLNHLLFQRLLLFVVVFLFHFLCFSSAFNLFFTLRIQQSSPATMMFPPQMLCCLSLMQSLMRSEQTLCEMVCWMCSALVVCVLIWFWECVCQCFIFVTNTTEDEFQFVFINFEIFVISSFHGLNTLKCVNLWQCFMYVHVSCVIHVMPLNLCSCGEYVKPTEDWNPELM